MRMQGGSHSHRKGVVIVSGGMDSTVLLYKCLNDGVQLTALGFDYGQRHRKELHSAIELCANVEVPYSIVNVSTLSHLLVSSLTHSSDVPEGHYEEEQMKATVVPNRNMIMLSMAAGVALSQKVHFVGYAAHGGDHAIYPDCRQEFVDACDHAIGIGNWNTGNFHLYAPFLKHTKADLVTLGTSLGVPFEKTWSCYKGGEVHCGKCGTCVERREAFMLAGIEDPVEYACSWEETNGLLHQGGGL